MELPHRDIYSGMVAEELAKNGAFGREETRCGFCFWTPSGGFGHAVFADEDECARQQFRQWMLGGFVSDRVSRRARVYDGDSAAAGDAVTQLESTVAELLRGEPLARLTTEVERRRSASVTAQEVIDSYDETFPGGGLPSVREEHAMLVAGMTALAWHWGLVEDGYRRESVKSVADALAAHSRSVRYGFVVRGTGAPKAYSNAYFPTVWDHWREAAGSEASPASLSMIARIPSFDEVLPSRRKERANAYLLSLFNGAYFETLDILLACSEG